VPSRAIHARPDELAELDALSSPQELSYVRSEEAVSGIARRAVATEREDGASCVSYGKGHPISLNI
jgi:hypothetical protein